MCCYYCYFLVLSMNAGLDRGQREFCRYTKIDWRSYQPYLLFVLPVPVVAGKLTALERAVSDKFVLPAVADKPKVSGEAAFDMYVAAGRLVAADP
jgi:hypothetical protein